MPRSPRIVVAGAIHHTCNRVARGESVLSEKREADLFIDPLRSVARRGDLTIPAWCLMANDYYLGR